MKIQILGSAAAEGWPGLFCECDVCREARCLGGRDIRRRTAYRINQDTLVDFGPDAYWQSVEFGIDLTQIRQIFFTHAHPDHFVPMQLFYRRKGYSSVTKMLDLYGNERVLRELREKDEFEQMLIRPHQMVPGKVAEAEGLRVLPVEASHSTPDETALNFVICDDEGKKVIIANDTGWWSEESWDLLRGESADLAIIECTYGLSQPDQIHYHLGARATVKVRDELQRIGALAPDASVVTNHFSHNSGNLYGELCSFFEPKGITVAWDGLTLEV